MWRGDLADLVVAHEAVLPRAHSYAYVDPGAEEWRLVVAAARMARDGDPEAAAAALATVGYEVAAVCDLACGGTHLLFRERPPRARCWGLYVLSLSVTAHDVVVEAPHPLHDRFTPEMAIEAYLRLDARAFLMAGAHRYANGYASPASDMARNPRSVFQGLHEALTGRATHVLQFHGFTVQDHPGYPNVLLSNGSPEPHMELFALGAALELQGETAGIYDGATWTELTAVANVQGRYTRSIGGRFYHMEYEAELRRDPARRSAVIEALVTALFPASGRASGEMPPINRAREARDGERAIPILAAAGAADHSLA